MYFANTNSIALADKHEQTIQKLWNRTTPIFIIILFSAAVTILRILLIPQFSYFIHFLLFLVQIGALTCIWYVINWLSGRLDRSMPFEKGPLKRIVTQVAFTILVVAPVFISIAIIVAPHVPAFVTKQFVAIAIMLFIVIIFLFNFGFYTFYFFKNWQASIIDKTELQVKAAQLEKEKFNLQYHQLKNQVNPHYLFNSLTSLDGLIQTNPSLASEFVRHMSKVYRYTLQHKESEVVSLAEELDFIQHYKELLKIRYGNGLVIKEDISNNAREKGIVMVSLQLLIDNAVKHNIIQASQPLSICITNEDDFLIVKNNIQLRKQIETSNKQGLNQLKELYSFLSDRPVQIEEGGEYFVIKIPLL